MNDPLLLALDAACSQARSVVLVRPMDEGPQYLVDHAGVETFSTPGNRSDSGSDDIPEALLRESRNAFARDDAGRWKSRVGVT